MNNVIRIEDASREVAISQYLEAKEQFATWKKRKEELDALIKSWIPEGNTVTIGDYHVRVDVSISHGVDTTALRKDFPELWKEYPKETARRSLVVV